MLGIQWKNVAILNTPAVNWDNTEWFDVKCTLSGVSLAKNDGVTSNADTQTATVVVKLLKTPVTDADALAALESGVLELHDKIIVRDEQGERLETTVGRIIFNETVRNAIFAK